MGELKKFEQLRKLEELRQLEAQFAEEMKAEEDSLSYMYEVWISDDQMRGDIVFHRPQSKEEEVSLALVLQDLRERGIGDSLNVAAIEYALENRMYERSLTFARGKMPVNGVDGWYEFLFERNFSLKPAIGQDGVADYHTLTTFASVKDNQLLMRYHEAIPGKSGYNIFGKELIPPPVKDLPNVPGEGFWVSSDGLDYYAEFSGKAEFKQGRLLVTRIHEIYEDISTGTGDVFFDGTVIIHGVVRSGMLVHATGDIIIDQVCEAATLSAGGDIVCRRGVLGNQTGKLTAKGSVTAQFLDKVEVKACNSIFCSSAIQCDLEAGKNIVISGRKGALIGGRSYAFETIECLSVGNASSTQTVVSAGITTKMVDTYANNGNTVAMLRYTAQNIKESLENCDENEREEYQKKLHENVTKLREFQEEQRKLEADIRAAINSKVVVHGEVNPGTVIELGGMKKDIRELHKQVEFTFQNNGIVVGALPPDLKQ